jgi:hypothetical protein
MTKQLQAVLATMLIVSSGMQAQTASTPAHTTARKAVQKKAPAESATERELRELREQMTSQQSQIDELKRQLADRDARLATASSDAQSANASAAAATAQAQSLGSSLQQNNEAVSSLNATVTDLKNTSAGLAQTISDTKKDIADRIDSPATLRYKGVEITPIGFFAFETVWRQRSMASDVNTPFNSTPYMNSGQAHVSELNFSGRQSRIGGLFRANPGPYHFAGYVEADFLSAGATSNENQSNSYTLRQRQIWGQAGTNGGFTVTGGQMWSLVTETKKGTDNLTENLPMTIDAQYHVGFSWARQPAIRFQQKFGGFTAAGSLEQAETIYSASNAPSNFFIGAAGTGGGLYNLTANYSNNVAPDVIVKAAYDAKYGHFEVGGLGRWFRSRIYPNGTATTPSSAGAYNDTTTGGGFFANLRVPATHYLDVGVHLMQGAGVGRYGTSTLPDVTVRPDGSLATIRSSQGLISLEGHPTKKLDIFGYAGGEYAQRTTYLNSKGVLVGYAPVTANNAGCNTEGLPTAPTTGLGSIGVSGAAPYNPGASTCAGVTRAVIEGTTGFVYRVYSNPKYGRLQYWVQYSYLTREAWTGVGGAPKATNNMVFTSMRYYIP